MQPLLFGICVFLVTAGCTTSGFKSPETWRFVVWTRSGGRIGTFDLELSGRRTLGTQYGSKEWTESGRVIDVVPAGTGLPMPKVGDDVRWRRRQDEALSISILDASRTFVLTGRPYAAGGAAGEITEEILCLPVVDFVQPDLGHFDAYRL